MSGANNSAAVSGAVVEDPHAHEAHIQVVSGHPTAEELAALLAVFAAASGTPEEPREQEQNLWGHPVDRLRYSSFSWQRVTLVERTHMRR
ncbi:acyl-CoA carboxylase epsilon subunit [Mycolicibacterium sp. XJ879]